MVAPNHQYKDIDMLKVLFKSVLIFNFFSLFCMSTYASDELDRGIDSELQVVPMTELQLQKLEEITMSAGSNPIVICKNLTVPSGYVIVAELMAASCPLNGTSDNAWKIKIPGSPEIVCLVSSIPEGYVMYSSYNSTSCPGFGVETAMRIKIPGARETVCMASPVPDGYIVYDQLYTSTCYGSNGAINAKKIQRI